MKLCTFVLCAFIAIATANCGCLKCNKHLTAVPQNVNGCPVKVIFREPSGPSREPVCSKHIPSSGPMLYSNPDTQNYPGQFPLAGYKLVPIEDEEAQLPQEECVDYNAGKQYGVKVQAPIEAPKPPSKYSVPLTGLKFRTDRVVLSAPTTPAPCNSDLLPGLIKGLIQGLQNVKTCPAPGNFAQEQPAPGPMQGVATGPIFDTLETCSICGSNNCNCNRYGFDAQQVFYSPVLKTRHHCPKLEHVKINNEPVCSRKKRELNLVKHGYNFVMNMLPQELQRPIQHTINSLARPTPSQPDFWSTIHSLGRKHTGLFKNNVVHGKHRLGNNLKSIKASDNLIQAFGLKENQFKDNMKEFGLNNHRTLPKLYSRYSSSENSRKLSKTEEAILKMKLKKLTGSHSKDLKDMKSDFLDYVMEKPKNTKRSRRSVIFGSDEVDLPFLEVSTDSASEEEEYDYESGSDSNEDEVLLGKSLMRNIRNNEPDVIIGKNFIQKAVQNEMSKYHKQMKLQNKKAVETDPFNLGNMSPLNPLFLLLNGPIHLLKTFNGVNKGTKPIFMSLPKLIFTTKKYFKNLGRNFKNNCLNLASNLIGDFDETIHPTIVKEVAQTRRYKRDITQDGNTKTKNNLDKEKYDKKEAEEKHNLNDKKLEQYEPEYSLVFNGETQNFRKVPDDHVRKKRYVLEVVNDDEIEDAVADQLLSRTEYLDPLREYYQKLNEFFNYFNTNYQPMQTETEEPYYEPNGAQSTESTDYSFDFRDSYEEVQNAPQKKKKTKVRKVKPKIIIDNNGLPFMEYNGMKRPLFFNKKIREVIKQPKDTYDSSSDEESNDKIVGLIKKAKEHSDIVGSVHRGFIPAKAIKERISAILEEIDALVHLDIERYDGIFDDLVKIQHVKRSIEQDWKRIILEDRVEDINSKIDLLHKFKDLQQFKDISVKTIGKEMKRTSSIFMKGKLTSNLIKLQKLQCLISSVVNDFEEHLKMKTHFNTKREVKYVDLLGSVNFMNAKTRNDMIKKLKLEKDNEVHKNIEMVNNLKKLCSGEENDEKLENAAKLVWELKNVEKLQKDTIKDMNKKLDSRFNIKKELKILFDLEKRHNSCTDELEELVKLKKPVKDNSVGKKREAKDYLSELKQKHEEILEKLKRKKKS